MRIGPLQVSDALGAAHWVQERLGPFGRSVTSIVPSGFAAYARVFHPAWHVEATPGSFHQDRRPVRWAEIARTHGRVAHPGMQFPGIAGVDPLRAASPRPDVWNTMPDLGSLPEHAAERLVAVLRGHTSTPDRCWFAVWDGWGGLAARASGAPTFATPGRDFYLLHGPIEGALQTMDAPHVTGDPSATPLYRRPTVGERLRSAVTRGRGSGARRSHGTPPGPGAAGQPRAGVPPAATGAGPPAAWQSVNLWWPEDRAWCVATEIDFLSTYVGGSAAAVAAVLADDDLEALAAQPGDAVTEDSDRHNPPPGGAP